MGVTRNLREAWRSLRRRPGFTAVTAATLAVAIAALTAVLTLANAVLVRPLPYPRATHVVVVRAAIGQGALSLPTLRDLRQGATSLAALSAFTAQSVNLTGLERPDRVRGGFVSADFFTALGVEPEHGRGFVAAEETP